MVLVSAVSLLRAAHAPEHSCGSCATDLLDASVSGESLLQQPAHLSKLVVLSRKNMVKAKDLLPLHLLELGVQTFGSEESLNQVVAESNEIHIRYAGVPVSLRIMAGDNAAERLGAETEDGQDYGLDALLDLARKSNQDKINMIDLGANYGVVSIAVSSKYPGLLRAVVVEPIPSTYFFLRWNLWLNRIPDLAVTSFVDASKPAGVLALHRGVMGNLGDSLTMCSSPGWSMNARAIQPTDETPCDCTVSTCTTVPGITTERLFDDFFPLEEVTLLKMDCEGCEAHSLPAIAKWPLRIKRLIGELHMPEEEHINLACLYDRGAYMTKVCKVAQDQYSCCLPLDCFPERMKCKW